MKARKNEITLTLNLFIRYTGKEAWVPAVYLKSLGFAGGSTPMGLRRWSGMNMRLREEKLPPKVPNNGLLYSGSTSK